MLWESEQRVQLGCPREELPRKDSGATECLASQREALLVLLAGRDPAVYVGTGLWLSNHDDLTIDNERDAFVASEQP